MLNETVTYVVKTVSFAVHNAENSNSCVWELRYLQLVS